MNKLREIIKSGRTALGSHISLNDSVITELIGRIGYDYLWIDTEHTALGLDALEKHLIAARAAGTSAIVRVPVNDASRIKPVLEMGPDGIIIPMVNSYEEAKRAMQACLYPPRGIRGYGPRFAARYGARGMQEYLEKVEEDTMRIIQIEHIDAVNDIERIVTIDEIDAFIIGPCDLSASMGLLGAPDDTPEIEEKLQKIISCVHSVNKPVGVSFGLCDASVIDRWLRRGVDMISIANDLDFLLSGGTKLYATMKELAKV